jgi:hypothetical protein
MGERGQEGTTRRIKKVGSLQGYIKLYRKTMCSIIWQDPYYFKLWMYCLMKATHKDHKQLVGNQMITLKSGEFVTGRKALSDDLNKGMKPKQRQSELTWWRQLNNLEEWGMLNIKKTNKYSIVSIVKWSEYQENEQQLNNTCTTTEQQLNTNKNVKNVKEKTYTSQFEEWWGLYPRKKEKKKAFSAFKKAIAKNPFELLVDGLKGYIAEIEKKNTPEEYIKHASSFLNGESFKDYLSKKSDDKPNLDPALAEKIEKMREINILIDKAKTIEEVDLLESEYKQLEAEVRAYG